MCMMNNSGEKEACEVANNLAALENKLNGATVTNIVRTIGTNNGSDQ